MALQVLQAPANQPTLNPNVSRTPVNQPTLAPRVASAPVQPTLSPNVVRQPVQPSLNPVVQSQPQGLGTITSIGTATEQRPYTPRVSLEAFGQLIKQQYSEYADRDNQTLALAMLSKYPQYADRVKVPTPNEPQGEKGLKGFGLGAVKGALSTVSNIGGLASKVASKIPNSLLSIPVVGPVVGAVKAVGKAGDTLEPYKGNFKPQGTAEKIGFGTEQVGEFFIPGGAVSKATKAAEAGVDAFKLGKVATGALKLGTKATISAGEVAGITALQGGSKEEVKTAAEFGAAFSIVSQGIGKLLQKAPETAWSSILKRTPTEAAKNPNLPAQVAKTGLAGASRASILEKSKQAIQNIEVALDDVLSQSKGKIGTLKIAPYLDELRNAYKNVPGEQASLDAIDNVMRDLLKRKSLTVAEANQLKRNIYGAIEKSYGKGMLDLPAKTEAQKLIAAGLKREIEKVVPEVKSLNEKQAVYLQVKKAIEKTLARTEGKGIGGTGIGLYDLLVGGIGTVGGAAAGNPLLGLGLVAAKKTGESSAVLSAVSKLINYFNELSPTKKLLFYNALKGLTVKGGIGAVNSASR